MTPSNSEREAERAAIVKWLREQEALAEKRQDATSDRDDANYAMGMEAGFCEAANAIERGDHMEATNET